ncbi:biliverdin-producing heme oxygenase [Flavobacterium sp.]|uniref:biliverdin-producing heme oxygenase n=1 Tax=Flavobacterium sp. TaxID=239 RepID=UPI00260C728A|nr:biliverdin-producing heme oxygenase [Flavobacterium sp.]
MDDAIITVTFLQRLRNTTAKSHEALESLPISKKITDPEVTLPEYKAYLQLMYGVVYDTEALVLHVLETIMPDIESRRKTTAIAKDLAAIGAVLPQTGSPLQKAEYTGDTAFALGVMYVVEGSSLGGRVIYKNIETSLGLNESNGASYFAGYGGTTGSKWKSFIDVLTGYADEHECEDEIIAGANFAFDAIKEHLS